MKFSNSEYTDFIYYYGMAHGNAREAQRLYREDFPNRRVPNYAVFRDTYTRSRETGCVSRCSGDRTRGFDSEEEDVVLDAVEVDPTTSVRKISRSKNVPKSKVHRIIKRHRFHPYHCTPVQALNHGDNQKRIQFCKTILLKAESDVNFLSRILWTDESTFTRDGTTNFHNMHFYSKENPHKKFQSRNQVRFSINVWAGVIGKKKILFPFICKCLTNNANIGNRIIGPLYLP